MPKIKRKKPASPYGLNIPTPATGVPRRYARYNPDSGQQWDDTDVPRKGHVGQLWWHNYNARPDITPPPPPFRNRKRKKK